MSHQPEPPVTWRAEVYDDSGDEPVSSHEYPGSSARGLAISFVQNAIRKMLAARIKAASGQVERIGDQLLVVGDDTLEPQTFALRGSVQRGTYQGEDWCPDAGSQEEFRLTEGLEIERTAGAAR